VSVALSSRAAFLAALDGASTIALGSYSLRAEGTVARALGRAAARGATVFVALEGLPFGPGGSSELARTNRRTAAELRAHGVRVRLAGAGDERLHLKASVVDGTAFFDDRNWPDGGNDTIVAVTDGAQAAAAAAAIAGRPSTSGALATEKEPALQLEADAIRLGGGNRVDMETESFGGCSVSKALRERAAGGAQTRLIVSVEAYRHGTPRERAELARLATEGVEIRLGRADQKLCVVGDRGWVGSANASYSPVPMLDWGLQTGDGGVLAGLAASFARDWAAARPLHAPGPRPPFSGGSQDATG
jgi:phosphatidylserine/phosphatidylglycerophosphate/cardiolipin synthase-like enzyme